MVVICLVLPCFLFSVSADDFDYQDYVGRVEVDGTDEIVTLYFSEDLPLIMLNAPEDSYSGNTIDNVYLSSDSSFDIFVYPIGNNNFYTYNIPEGSEFSFSLAVSGTDLGEFTGALAEYSVCTMWYLNSDHDTVYDYTSELSVEFSTGSSLAFFDATNVISSIPDADLLYSDITYIHPELFAYEVFVPTSGEYSFSIDSVFVTLTIKEAVDIGDEDLTNEIVDQLQDQGKKLDEISGKVVDIEKKIDDQWNAEVTPNDPNGSDIVGDLDGVESDLRDSASGGLADGLDIFTQARIIISSYQTSFLVLTSILENFIDIPFFNGILVVSVALGLVGLLINLLGSIVGRARNEDARSSRSRGSKKGG